MVTHPVDDPGITADNIKEMLDAVQADREAKKVFLAMPREEQLLAILGMIAYTNNLVANLQKNIIDYRKEREGEERQHHNSLENTGERIAQGIKRALAEKDAKEFHFGQYLLDRVLPGIIQFIVLSLLALIFAKDALLQLLGR